MAVKTKTIKEHKKKAIAEIKEKIAASKIIIFTDYKGMTVKQVTELKRKLRETHSEFKVYKNTYFSLALSPEFESLKEGFAGQIGTIFGSSDIVAPAKILMNFVSENEKPGVVRGIVDNEIFEKDKLVALSKVPPKEELIARVVGGIKSPLYNLVSVLSGPIRKFVYAVDAVRKKKVEGGES